MSLQDCQSVNDGRLRPEFEVKRGFGHSNDGVGLPVFRGRKPNNMGSHETGVAYGIEEVFASSMTQVIDQLGSQGGEVETRASGGIERVSPTSMDRVLS